MTNAELIVELLTGSIEERATGIFVKRLGNGREVYTCKCPNCGTLHGGFKTFPEAWSNRKCKMCFRNEIERTKKDIQKVDEPEKPRDIFTQTERKPTVLGEAEDDDDLVKELTQPAEDYIGYGIYDGNEYYPVTRRGYIGRQGWTTGFGEHWKVKGMTFHHWGKYLTLWKDLLSRLDAGETLKGYLFDIDHGTNRQWGRKVEVYKRDRRDFGESIEDEDLKAILGGAEGLEPSKPGEVTKMACLNMRRGDRIYHRTKNMADGSPLSVRVMGRCQTWATRPNEFRIPVKFGLYQSFYITDDSAGSWTTVNPRPEA